MHIFKLVAPEELAGLYFGPNRFEPLSNGVTLLAREHIHVRQHLRVRFQRPSHEDVVYRFETIDYQRPIRSSYFELPDS